jgi:thioesterase domain-containing protein/acyl carrier protein
MITMVWPAETSLRFLLTGGEALLHAPPRPLPFAVINNYGPTECTVVATSSVVVPGSTGAPAIGRPIAGTRIYLLNEEGRQVSDDGIGEIYIGGKGLGRGYRNLPDATQWSFVSDPFAGIAGARMYRTGDRGKRRPNGEIEFRGRLDRQTKIRGQRIELDEIGSVLEGHPKIRFATAVVRRAARGEDQIVGYILPREDSTLPTTKELQEHLLQSLPEYMVPAVFVRLQALPLSPNGKIDLTALAAPSDENLLERPVAKTPSTPTEEKLLVLVRELLEQPAVTIEDNFFLAGGHSLLGMQLVMRLRNAFDVDLSLRELFESPTVERLAVTVERRQTEQRLTQIWIDLLTGPVVGLETSFFESGGNAQLLKTLQERIAEEFGKRFTVEELGEHSTIGKQAKLICHTVSEAPALPPGVLPLKTSTTRNAIFWVHYLSTNLARAMDDDQAFVHISLATEDIASLGSAPSMHDIAASLVLKILATQPKGPYMIGGYCIGGILAYEISSQLQASGHEVSLLILLDTPSPSYFESPNLLTPRLRHPLYLLKRIIRLGPKASFERIRKRLTDTVKARPARTEVDFVQSMIETAAASYLPAKYIGKVALILAEDHPPHIDFLSEWRLLVPNSLHTQYLLAHHSELMDESVVQTVANAMASQIKWVADEARLSESGGDDRLVESRAQANPVSDPIFG